MLPGQLTVRADSGFYNHPMVAACRDKGVRYSITVRQHPSLRNLIEAIPEDAWTPIPYWMESAADVAETTYTPFQHEPDAVPLRLTVRWVKPTPDPNRRSSVITPITPSSPTGRATPWNWKPIIASDRPHHNLRWIGDREFVEYRSGSHSFRTLAEE